MKTRKQGTVRIAAGMATGMALGILAPTARADAGNKTAWGAATAGLGVAALAELKNHPGEAAMLGVGAAVSYDQYHKAGRQGNAYDTAYDSSPNDNNGYNDRSGDVRPGGADYGSIRYSRDTREVTGVLANYPDAFKRTMKVRLDDGEIRTVDVPKGASVRRFGRPASVHDLRKGESVRIQLDRFYRNATLHALRVDVFDGTGRYNHYQDRPSGGYNDPPAGSRDGDYNDRSGDSRNGGYNDDRAGRDSNYGRSDSADRNNDPIRLSGEVSSIDSRNGVLRITVDGQRLTVNTDNADISDRQGRITLRDLENGQTVTVEGRRDGDTFTATSVTVR